MPSDPFATSTTCKAQRAHAVAVQLSPPNTILHFSQPATPSVQGNTPLSQIRSRLLDLFHQLFVCFRDIVEGEHAVSEFRQKVSAEGHKGPEGNLWGVVRAEPMYGESGRTYHGHNVFLDLSWQRNEAEECAQV